MMSGYYDWHNGNSDWGAKNGRGRFWSSTPYVYTYSRYLYFNSTEVLPRDGSYKPNGFTLRCVAFQSSPQPSSFGYGVGLSLLG